ncbi:zf-HC2 domain-containing protein [Haliangium sp.]|uniref:zf-HC2 domain-containing protein n=1 Tax=Haliangium sp. TaxID=2663208 RepID=UPI003D0A7015
MILDCLDMRLMLGLYLDGELLADERELVEQHCHACALCRRRARRGVALQAVLRTRLRSASAPPGLRQRLALALDRADRDRRARALLRWVAPGLGLSPRADTRP